MIGMKNVLF